MCKPENGSLNSIPYFNDESTVVNVHGEIADTRIKTIRNPLYVGTVHGRRGRLAIMSATLRSFFVKNINLEQLYQMTPQEMIYIAEIIKFTQRGKDHHIEISCKFVSDDTDETILGIRNREILDCDICAVMFHRISIPEELYVTEDS